MRAGGPWPRSFREPGRGHFPDESATRSVEPHFKKQYQPAYRNTDPESYQATFHRLSCVTCIQNSKSIWRHQDLGRLLKAMVSRRCKPMQSTWNRLSSPFYDFVCLADGSQMPSWPGEAENNRSTKFIP